MEIVDPSHIDDLTRMDPARLAQMTHVQPGEVNHAIAAVAGRFPSLSGGRALEQRFEPWGVAAAMASFTPISTDALLARI